MAEHKLVDLLPEVINATATPGSPLTALCEAANDMHDPVVAVLDDLDALLDPFRTEARFVRYLAGWVDLGWLGANDSGAGTGMRLSRLRDVIGASAQLSARRGTPAGLKRFLHLATGLDGFGVEVVPGAFHMRVRVPEAARDQLELIGHLVRALRPAHVTSEVAVGDGVTGSNHGREDIA